MKQHTTTAIAVAVAFAGGLGLGVSTTSSPSPTRPTASEAASTSSGPAEDVVALVNGVPVTEADVQLKLEAGAHDAVPSEERRRHVLETLVRREALAQKARALGLDRDPAFTSTAQKMGAQMRAREREELSELLLRRETSRRGAPSEDSVRAYFDRNVSRIRKQLHVFQILRRTEAQAIEARNALQAGKPFEEVAASLLPGLPEGKQPWDLGFLSFSQIPEPWRSHVYELAPGQTSGIIRGPNERYWIVKIIEVKDDPNVSFESVREAVVADMAQHGAEASREALEDELTKDAKIEIVEGSP